MSVIHILVGLPGVGKSVNGFEFINPNLEIVNQDDILLKYKAEGYTDYNQISAFKTDQIIKQKLIEDADFALELNLGFPNQWKYAKSIKQFRDENKLFVLLFFTDSLDLCLKRAQKRHENGLHLVEPETIKTMYNQTIPLFMENFDLVDYALFIDVDEIYGLKIAASYNRVTGKIDTFETVPVWFADQVYPFLEQQTHP